MTKTGNLIDKEYSNKVTTLRGDTLEEASKIAIEKLGYVATEEILNYYESELRKLNPSEQPKVRVYTDNARTNWLDLNAESVKIITSWMWDCVCGPQNPERKEDNAS